jgi:hypothetical protein
MYVARSRNGHPETNGHQGIQILLHPLLMVRPQSYYRLLAKARFLDGTSTRSTRKEIRFAMET